MWTSPIYSRMTSGFNDIGQYTQIKNRPKGGGGLNVIKLRRIAIDASIPLSKHIVVLGRSLSVVEGFQALNLMALGGCLFR